MNHLDIPSRERFEEALDAFPGTVLMAVHDRTFIDRYATAIWNIEEGTIRRYPDRHSATRGSLIVPSPSEPAPDLIRGRGLG